MSKSFSQRATEAGFKTEIDWHRANPNECPARLEMLLEWERQRAANALVKTPQQLENETRALRQRKELARKFRTSLEAIESSKPTKATAVVAEWHANVDVHPVLLMFGPPGAGKTFAAAKLAVEHYPDAEVINSQRLCSLARANFGEEAAEYRRLLDKKSLLVVDEIGFELDRAVAKFSLHEVVNDRPDLPTILISNLIKDVFDERTLDRMEQYGLIRQIEGKSIRRESRKATR